MGSQRINLSKYSQYPVTTVLDSCNSGQRLASLSQAIGNIGV